MSEGGNHSVQSHIQARGSGAYSHKKFLKFMTSETASGHCLLQPHLPAKKLLFSIVGNFQGWRGNPLVSHLLNKSLATATNADVIRMWGVCSREL